MLVEPRCYTRRCIHFQGVLGDEEPDQVPYCTAFPDGIPPEIAYGENLHLEPYPGDHGITFQAE